MLEPSSRCARVNDLSVHDLVSLVVAIRIKSEVLAGVSVQASVFHRVPRRAHRQGPFACLIPFDLVVRRGP